MNPRAIFEVLLYLGLLVGCLFFVEESIIEYSKGITSYSVTYEPLLMKDRPTVTFCIEYDWLFGPAELIYGSHSKTLVRNYALFYRHEPKKGFHTLVENRFVKALSGLNMRLDKIPSNKL